MIHEGVESVLMTEGMPYRVMNYDSDGVIWFTRQHYGAHEISPHETHSNPYAAWRKLGMELPPFEVLPDLSMLGRPYSVHPEEQAMRTASALVLAERLERVDWVGSFDRTRSRVALMREFMRRSALWAQETRCGEWPFFDVAGRIDPAARIDADIVSVIADKIGLQQPVITETIEWALNFAVLSDIRTDLADLPSPFEPLVQMYERGGTFSLDSTGHIEVDTAANPKGSVGQALGRVPLDLDAKSLNALDEE
ncbi:hypothetical protein [Streptomyces sp. MST-110588]|uniref:hypothetical protein n=1 Tax=Streptomyces sp. MST-110588 TaxID=2833628 RepID=UPI001F5C85BA|nr:hypothetical protein [Streptomyces sp. MST-110588]UNO40665.1 hypothetical protein KGS77_15150 [Streptomyces sp. MST-110588]